jgi:hypothetical protein
MEEAWSPPTVEVVVRCSETSDLQVFFRLLQRLGGAVRAEGVVLFGYCDGNEGRPDAPDTAPLLTALDVIGGFRSTVALLRRFFTQCPCSILTISVERYGKRVSVAAGSSDRRSIAELVAIISRTMNAVEPGASCEPT